MLIVELLEFWIFGVLWYGGQVLFGWFSFSLWFCHVPSVLSFLQCWATQKWFKSFPCTHQNCHQTFKSAAGHTRHWNTAHHEITPTLELDPDIAISELIIIQSSMVKFSMTMQATELTYDLQPFLVTRMATTFPNTPNQCHCNQLMLQLTIHGIHSTIGWHLTLQTSILQELQSSESKGQSCFGSVDGCCAEGWWWWRATMVFCREKCMPLLMQFRRVMLCGKTISFKYNGPLPKKPTKMDAPKTYELCTHDSHLLLHQQLSTTSFADQINYAPYCQFQANGDHIWSKPNVSRLVMGTGGKFSSCCHGK